MLSETALKTVLQSSFTPKITTKADHNKEKPDHKKPMKTTN